MLHVAEMEEAAVPRQPHAPIRAAMTTTVDRVNASTKSGMDDFLVRTNAGRAAMVSPRVLGPILNVCKQSTQHVGDKGSTAAQ